MVQGGQGKRARSAQINALVAAEEAAGLFKPETYKKLNDKIEALKTELNQLLRQFKSEGKRIVGFGAPAKATTLLYRFGIGKETIEAIIDDSRWKQGLFSPGQHIPIVSSDYLYEQNPPPDCALILAWNFSDSIIGKHQKFLDNGGVFIVPLPQLEVKSAL